MDKAQFNLNKAINIIRRVWNPVLAAVAVLILGLIAFDQSQNITRLQDKEADLSLKIERLEESLSKQAKVITTNNYTITKFHGEAQSPSTEEDQ
jgi:hypothetical protein